MRDIYSLRSSIWFRLSVAAAWSYVAGTYLWIHLTADQSGGTFYNIRTSQYGLAGELVEVAIGLYAFAAAFYLYVVTLIFFAAQRRGSRPRLDAARAKGQIPLQSRL